MKKKMKSTNQFALGIGSVAIIAGFVLLGIGEELGNVSLSLFSGICLVGASYFNLKKEAKEQNEST